MEVARAQSTTRYSEIAPLAGLSMDSPADRNTIRLLLDAINDEENRHGRPMLSAVVIRIEDNMPGDGFFTCAARLGRMNTGDDPLTFWLHELRRVHDCWTGQQTEQN